jgi:multiple sugar transport system substrate-binding protein
VRLHPRAAARARRAGAVLALVALALAASCAPGGRTREVVFWEFWSPAALRPILARFERAHPGVHVRLEQLAWRTGPERIAAAAAAGNVPDLVELGAAWMPRMLAGGKLVDWSAGIADLKSGLRGWELCSLGETMFGVPWMLDTRALFWNKELFARAGLDTTRGPETWDELRRAAARIQALGHGVHGYGVQVGEPGVLAQTFLPFVWSNGGEVLSADGRSAVFDSAATRAALAFYLGLRQVGTLGRQDALDRAFEAGRLGCEISGGWLLERIPAEAPRLRYGVALVPAPSGGTHASWAGGEVLASFTEARQKPLALELARFLVQPDNALAFARAVKRVQPASVNADTCAYYRRRPAEMAMVRQTATARFTPTHPAWGDMEAAIEDEVGQALSDKKTAAQAVADAQARLAKLAGGS